MLSPPGCSTTISKLASLGIKIQMVDVEVFDNQHSFILQGFQVHNSSNEYKVTAARDTGLRPIMSQLEDFLNARILPLLDKTLAESCQIQLLGLDANTKEKEAQEIAETSQLYGTYDDILGQVEKDPIGLQWGGQYPMNPQVQAMLEKFLTVGEIKFRFFGDKEAKSNPELNYRLGDPTSCAVFQMKLQAQMAPPPAPGAAAPPGGGQVPPQGGEQPQGQGGSQEQAPEEQAPNPQDFSAGLDQALSGLSKGEEHLLPHHAKLYRKQEKAIKSMMDSWEKESLISKKAVMELAKKLLPKEE